MTILPGEILKTVKIDNIKAGRPIDQPAFYII